MLFEGFESRDLQTPRGTVHARIAGSGLPLLLLHGYPQTHLMWHAVAPRLAAGHFLAEDAPDDVAADLEAFL